MYRRFLCSAAALLVLLGATTTAGASVDELSRSADRGVASTSSFVRKAYEDFLLRAPSPDEAAWWGAYLGGGGTRAAVIESLLKGDEFQEMWVLGSALRYLDDVYADDPHLASWLSSLTSSGDYLGVEVSVLASEQYFREAGGTTAGFLDHLFRDVLDRAPDASGLSYWTSKLASGTSRASVARSLLRSDESAALQVRGHAGATSCLATSLEDLGSVLGGSYCLILDRPADPSGATYWTSYMTSSGNQLIALWISLASSSEYYNRS